MRINLPFYYKIAIIYTTIALAYIYFSDYVLRSIVDNLDENTLLQTIKGSAFVLISGCLIFKLIKSDANKIDHYYKTLIAERKQSFDELKKSEENCWTVFNHNPIPMWIYDLETLKFLLVNDAACNKYGYSKDEFYAIGINDIRPESDRAMILDLIKSAAGTKHIAWQEPFRHRTKYGQEILVNIESSLIEFNNRLARVVTATDVTRKIENARLLVEANRRLQNASDIAGIGYWSKNAETGEIYWSDMMYTIFDLDKDAIELTPENINKYVEFDHGGPGCGIRESERMIHTRAGNVKWILERTTLIKEPNATCGFIEGVVMDITERKTTEREVSTSNERFKMVAAAAVEAIIDWNIENGQVFWGNGFKQLFGYEPDNRDTTLWIKHIHPQDKYRVLHSLATALNDTTQTNYFEEFRYIKADGEIAFVEHRGVFTRDANGAAIRAVAAMIDVTRLRVKMATIHVQNEQLREIAWMQSHVVRAPLANLMGITELIRIMNKDGCIPNDLIDNLEISARRLDMVVRDIVAKTETLESIDA